MSDRSLKIVLKSPGEIASKECAHAAVIQAFDTARSITLGRGMDRVKIYANTLETIKQWFLHPSFTSITIQTADRSDPIVVYYDGKHQDLKHKAGAQDGVVTRLATALAGYSVLVLSSSKTPTDDNVNWYGNGPLTLRQIAQAMNTANAWTQSTGDKRQALEAAAEKKRRDAKYPPGPGIPGTASRPRPPGRP